MYKMEKVEVLSHITAPSGFKDDTRYLAQAAAVAGFEAGNRIDIFGLDDSIDIVHDLVQDEEWVAVDHAEISTFGTSLNLSAWIAAEGAVEGAADTPVQQAARELLKQCPICIDSESLLDMDQESGKQTNDANQSGTPRAQVSPLESPYSVPSCGEKARSLGVLATRMPEVLRPKTAPVSAVTPKLLVSGKRLRSHSSSLEPFTSIIPDSQKKRGFLASGVFATASPDLRKPTNFRADHLPKMFVSKRPVERDPRPAKRQQIIQEASLSEQSQPPNRALLLRKDKVRQSRRSRAGALLKTRSNLAASTSTTAPTVPWPPKPRPRINYPPLPEQTLPTKRHVRSLRIISPPPPPPPPSSPQLEAPTPTTDSDWSFPSSWSSACR